MHDFPVCLFNPAFRGCQNLINSLCVSDIQVVPEHGRHHRRSSSYRTLAVPHTRTTLGDGGFAVAVPRVWNSLLATIRQITSYGQFKQRLKTHLFGAWKTWGRKTQHIVTLDYCVQYKFLLTYLLTLTHRCCHLLNSVEFIDWVWTCAVGLNIMATALCHHQTGNNLQEDPITRSSEPLNLNWDHWMEEWSLSRTLALDCGHGYIQEYAIKKRTDIEYVNCMCVQTSALQGVKIHRIIQLK